MINNKKGVSLVEVMIALIIGAVISLYSASFFVGAAGKGSEAWEWEFALQEAKNVMETRILIFGGTAVGETIPFPVLEKAQRGFIDNVTTRYQINVRNTNAIAVGVFQELRRRVVVSVTWPISIPQPDARRRVVLSADRSRAYPRRNN